MNEQDVRGCVVEAVVELAGMFDICRRYGLISKRDMRQMVEISSKMGDLFLERFNAGRQRNEREVF
jgi:hypothetical protein